MITFTNANNRKEILFAIPDDEISKYDALIETFNIKYNNLFDIYSDFTLYQNHLDYLIALTDDVKKDFDKFAGFLRTARASNQNIVVIGN